MIQQNVWNMKKRLILLMVIIIVKTMILSELLSFCLLLQNRRKMEGYQNSFEDNHANIICYLVLTLLSHPLFRRKGDHLHLRKKPL